MKNSTKFWSLIGIILFLYLTYLTKGFTIIVFIGGYFGMVLLNYTTYTSGFSDDFNKYNFLIYIHKAIVWFNNKLDNYGSPE